MYRKLITAAIAAMLVLGLTTTSTFATALCNPGRGSQSITSDAGKRDEIVTGSNLNIEHMQAVVDNQIPYVLGGAYTWTFMVLQDKLAGKVNARVMLGIGWGSTQGLLSSTKVRMLVTNNDGSVIMFDDQSKSMANFGGTDVSPTLDIYAPDSADASELYVATVNGETAYTYTITFPYDGAEDFEYAKVFTETYNNASQIPGTSSDNEYFNAISYDDQFGTTYGFVADANILTGNAAANAAVVYASGYVRIHDAQC